MRGSRRRYAGRLLLWLLLWLVPLHGAAESDTIELHARSAVLLDGRSGRVLYGKEEETELPMASTTKIMTCILALESLPGDTVCTVSAQAAAQPKVHLGMVQGDCFYLKDLLYSLMLESHNDTAVCIAEAAGGSVEGFAAKMNEKARAIGCEHTYYITPNGLDAEDANGAHHTTARELALVMRYCLTASPEAERFLEITRAASHAFSNVDGTRHYQCSNHNTFLSMMDGALSGKTGFTGKAGYCYVGALQRGDKLLIVALLACGWPNNKGYKWTDAKKLMNYGLEHFETRELIDPQLQAGPLTVAHGQSASVPAVVRQPESLRILLRPEEQVRIELRTEPELEAPVRAGQQVGTVRYLLGTEVYASYPVVAGENVALRDYPYCLREIWNRFCMGV